MGNACLLGLRVGDVIDIMLQTLGSLLCLPGVWTLVTEEHFNLLNGLSAGFWVGKEKLDRSKNTKGSKKQEKTVLDVLECRRDEEANSSVELGLVSRSHVMEQEGRRTSQLPMAEMPIPVARVSSDQTSAAYIQQTGAKVRA